jgi:hypothetical protein
MYLTLTLKCIIPCNQDARYKHSYEQLKELKAEIEHLQYLLEHARHRLTRDFEHWYVNVYMDSDQGQWLPSESSNQGLPEQEDNTESTLPTAGAKAAMQVMRVRILNDDQFNVWAKIDQQETPGYDRAGKNGVHHSLSAATLIDSPRASIAISKESTRLQEVRDMRVKSGTGASVQDDILAFYKAREKISNSGRSTPHI